MELKLIFKPGIPNAWIFMSVFIIQMLVIMFAGERVRKRSHVPDEVKRDKLEKYISIIANIVWFIALVFSIFLSFKTGTIWFYTGLFVFIIGLTLLTIATINFITTPSDQLITKGVYKLSRHPMYLATFFICLASGIASGSLIFICLSIIMAICFHKEALVEEKYCLEHYGPAYKEYIINVSRWISIPQRT
jgi:protein-S-isoprenylcysteine O-methyltransferase Ste14